MYNGLLEGKIRSSRQNWNNVIQQFAEIVKNYPKSQFADDAQYNIGMCYIWSYGLLKDSPQKAIKAFDYLIKHYPDSEFVDDACYWEAYAYSLKKDYKRAVEEYQEFIDKYPESKLYKEEATYQIEECRAKLSGRKEVQPADIGTSKPPQPAAEGIEGQQGNSQTKPTAEVSTQQQEPQVKDIRFNSSPGFTRVVVDLSGPVKYKAGRLKNPDRIYVDIQTAVIASAKQNITVNDKVIKTIRVAQFNENTVRIVLDIKRIQRYNVFHLKEPDRIVLDVYSFDVLLSKPRKDDTRRPHAPTLVRQLGLKVKTIVIDPGHGGKDPGTVSESGLQEKNVVLDIAKHLKELLESSGSYNVYLTREADIFIPLEDRTAFANQKGADIFISIHVNSSKNQDIRGIETYYLSLASDEEARLTAALENASAGRTINDLRVLLNRILRGTKVKESRELARTIQSRLRQHTGANDRGIRRAPFIVLIGANAPSILVELGFMSNKRDEHILQNEEYKSKIARALMEAVEDYIKTIDQAS